MPHRGLTRGRSVGRARTRRSIPPFRPPVRTGGGGRLKRLRRQVEARSKLKRIHGAVKRRRRS